MRKEVVRWYFIWNAFESTASCLHIYMSIGTTTMKRWSVDTCCSVVGWYQQSSNFGRKKSFEIFFDLNLLACKDFF